MTMEVLRVRLTGVAPLVMHAARLADPLDDISREISRHTAKRRKTEADHQRIADLEFTGGLWLDRGRPCIPAEAIEAAISQAAARRRAKSLFRSGVSVHANAILEYEGPGDVEALRADPAFRLRVSVAVSGRRLMRTRPMFERWTTVVAVHYLASLINRADLVDVLMIAGDQIGVGDFRPRCGRFSVVKTDEGGQAASRSAQERDAGRARHV